MRAGYRYWEEDEEEGRAHLPVLMRPPICLGGILGPAGMALSQYPLVHGRVLSGMCGKPLMIGSIHRGTEQVAGPSSFLFVLFS